MDLPAKKHLLKLSRFPVPILFALFMGLFVFSGFVPVTTKIIDRPEGIYIYGEKTRQAETDGRLEKRVRAILEKYHPQASYGVLTIAYPYNKSIFPPEIIAPSFKWFEKESNIRNWLVTVSFDGRYKPLYIFCDKPYWTPGKEIWELMKKHSVQGPAQIVILGLNRHSQFEIFSKGVVSISTSRDRVGAPIMFRRVPPSFAYASKHPELIEWVLGDISSDDEPPVIMSKQPFCSSCHTFSQDGSVIGMDMDYNNDKGAYFLAAVREDIRLTDKDFVSWNDLPRTDGRQNTGLFSRISPDGKHIASTINEILFLVKIPDPYFSQLFFPLQGSLAYYSNRDGKITALSGADLPEFVQTDPSWSPDGRDILFSRAARGKKLLESLAGQTVFSVEHNDIDRLNKQYPIQFNVYRIPFNSGTGGKAEPLAGASHNGKSNYFPRYSPDGKWIVFTQSETGIAIQPDSRLFIVPTAGGDAKMMR
ncbi:TolB family protein, partial [Thermodesulfobacteriota bacterium]